MKRIGKYEQLPFSKNRQNITLILKEGARKHNVHALIEVDVTIGRGLIRQYEKKTGIKISFTAWIIKCVGEATKHHRELNTYRHGVRKSIVFEDVDIPIPVERTTRKEKRPMAYVIRKADKKNIIDITTEIRAVQKETVTDATQLLGDNLTKFEKFALGAPMPIKKMILSIARRSAFLRKEFMGTVGVSSIGMFGKFSGWAIPLGIPATLVVMGGVIKKPGVIDDEIVIREFLPLTITVDHDIVDGAPLARFVDHLTNLIESGFGLIDL